MQILRWQARGRERGRRARRGDVLRDSKSGQWERDKKYDPLAVQSAWHGHYAGLRKAAVDRHGRNWRFVLEENAILDRYAEQTYPRGKILRKRNSKNEMKQNSRTLTLSSGMRCNQFSSYNTRTYNIHWNDVDMMDRCGIGNGIKFKWSLPMKLIESNPFGVQVNIIDSLIKYRSHTFICSLLPSMYHLVYAQDKRIDNWHHNRRYISFKILPPNILRKLSLKYICLGLFTAAVLLWMISNNVKQPCPRNVYE